MFQNLISSLVNPKIVFALIKRMLSDAADHDIEQYDMYFFNDTQEVYFIVHCPVNVVLPSSYDPETRTRKYIIDDNPTFKKQINMAMSEAMKQNIKNGETLDIGILRYFDNGQSIVAEIYFRDNENNKQKLTHKIV